MSGSYTRRMAVTLGERGHVLLPPYPSPFQFIRGHIATTTVYGVFPIEYYLTHTPLSVPFSFFGGHIPSGIMRESFPIPFPCLLLSDDGTPS
jgi:hypothetical protein